MITAHRIDEPRTAEEREIWREIETLTREYQARLEPLRDRLVAIASMKTPRWYLVDDDVGPSLD